MIFDAMGLNSHDSITGDLNWMFPWGDNSDEQVNVCQPAIIDEQTVLISSGYGRGSALLEITGREVECLWQTKRLRSKFSSLVVVGGFVYGLDEGILSCVRIKDGRSMWKRGRYGHGQLIQLDEFLIVQTESGDVAVVAIDPGKFEEILNVAALGDRTWNQPVVSNGYLLLRNDREAVSFGLPMTKQRESANADVN